MPGHPKPLSHLDEDREPLERAELAAGEARGVDLARARQRRLAEHFDAGVQRRVDLQPRAVEPFSRPSLYSV
jgi:hypothetical protein